MLAAVVWFFSRLRVFGVERLPADPRFIVASNHPSHIDTGLVAIALPLRLRRRLVVMAAADNFFTSRRTSILSALLMGAIPVDRFKVDRRSSQLPRELLNQGFTVLVYPEGGRSLPDGTMQEHKPGAAWLSHRADVAVVPTWISGSAKVLPKGGSRPRRSKCTVTFGEPIKPAEGESSRRYAKRLEEVLVALGREVEGSASS